ncbi:MULTISPECIES: DUF2939 domain-containing protein [Acinetobacter]|uniref:DUF2939 domain-containing protein n=1 Tax=Acinetobacter corruptisaponis TaxID=3045147 RepID=A0ABY8S4W8_9GAMM|nr:DUF2939 domain-containing protein [Acinetobacter sp. KCTC 92772]WHP04734.1 DUF2939 domain-containing protein [Acinetobacter sp. KCTC 92772]
MSKKLQVSIVVIILLVFVYVYASPYLVIYQIRQALKHEDSTALASYVDFPSVRQGIKDQLNTELVKKFPEHAQASEGGFAAFGALLASSMVDKMVDVMVSPQGVAMLLQGKKLKESLPFQAQPEQSEQQQTQAGEQAKEKLSYHGKYQSFNRFTVEIRHPQKQPPINVILQRQGLSWKVTQIVLPIEQLK